ncbi:MAG: tetraacyldisaccharide 4'-kinase [Lewinellaceae bacterium]|nr:tetraacyldisaccharide 4'-kinase [Lewinellaceae bacterium]
MVQQILFRILLAPFSLLYGIGVLIHQWLYRIGLLRSVQFSIPVISVGNLSVGGSGKTPHIEYLVRLLKDYVHVAIISRGYRRKSKGYLLVDPRQSAEQAGDEPLQFKRKYPAIPVAVSESRTIGVTQLIADHPETQVVLLDDAFQHRAIRPGLQIVLTTYQQPFTRDYLLPSGRLREWRSAYRRADIIIVSKCPPQLPDADRQRLLKEINPLPHQRVFFSYYAYGQAYFLFQPDYRLNLHPGLDVVLLSAIAGTDYLLEFLEPLVQSVTNIQYEDHHLFTKYEVAQLKLRFDRLESEHKAILTTEKDAMRLELHREYLLQEKMPIFVLPVAVRFHGDDGARFDDLIQQFLLNFKS